MTRGVMGGGLMKDIKVSTRVLGGGECGREGAGVGEGRGAGRKNGEAGEKGRRRRRDERGMWQAG